MDFGQTFRLYVNGNATYHENFIEKHMVNRYSSYFKVHFFNWPCSCALNIFTNNKSTFAQLFVSSSNVSVINFSCLFSIYTGCSECPAAAATHDRSFLRNDMIALSMNSYGKSLFINKTVFSLGISLCHVSLHSVPALHSIHDNPFVILIWV